MHSTDKNNYYYLTLLLDFIKNKHKYPPPSLLKGQLKNGSSCVLISLRYSCPTHFYLASVSAAVHFLPMAQHPFSTLLRSLHIGKT